MIWEPRAMWLYFHVVAAVCLATAFAEELVNSTEHPLRRQTRFGIVEGYADDALGLWVWRGVPFAKPPIGSLRWRAPEDLEPWEGVRTAKERAPECIQPKLAPPLTILPEATGSEDCLYLNIYRPQTREENLPVYVFLHGGGNVFGGAQGWYIQELARKANLVLVEVQYRLGPFGYFTHPIFRSGPPTAEHSGNFGTLDQIKALQWVRGNIAAFGGNPFNVTLGGHSGGGHDVAQLNICPLARGLFQRAVIQGDPWLAQSVAMMDHTANRTIENALAKKGLATDLTDAQRVRQEMSDAELVAFLREMPADELLTAHLSLSGQKNPVWSFVIQDGHVIPDSLYSAVESGRFAHVPIMIGANQMESGFANMNSGPQYPGMPDYRQLVQVVEGTKKLEEVLPTEKDRGYWLKGRHYASLFYRAMAHEHARRLAARQCDVYVFSFNWGGGKVCPEIHTFTFGAAHCLDLPFLFGSADKTEMWNAFSTMFRSFTEANRPGRLALSDAMVSYLAQFVRTGNPNNAVSGSPEWQAWSNDEGGPKVLQLDAGLQHAQIAMDTQELSVAGVWRDLCSEPPELQKHVMALVSVIQPFLAEEHGGHE